MSEEDWLALEKPPEQHPVMAALYDDVTPAMRDPDIEAPKVEPKHVQTLRALRQLKPQTRTFIRAYLACNCNGAAARRMLNQTQGWAPDSSQVSRWMRWDDNFRIALAGLKANLLELAGVDPESLVLRTNAIVEDALTPVPILHHGEDTGFREVDRANALRGIENMAKWAGMGREEKHTTRVVVTVVKLDGPAKAEAEVIEGEYTDV